MAKPGQNVGNRHAAKKPGERKRVTFTVSLSGERLLHLEHYLKSMIDLDEATDAQIAGIVRHMLNEWIEQLVIK